ncbi:hypothetical protein [Fluviicola taffensis]|uniref:Bacterial Pleckstrin homology domain-containing protein n=1 Tax=Fluviicola taffensis (strain DSM 16823 / NCIMB 13979 / RW262) TaxID=755732 RepID=F2IIP7_FLUTR|nr:hypothetical protein [Fluviicola taffensis]AEA46009.1 hypothetical protein Fluta_4047 [Fluviicola taffensis DSM 16823]
MTENYRFTETQKFRQWWLWFILAGIKGVMGFFIVTQVIAGKPFGNNVANNISLLVAFSFMLVLSFLFFIMKLETRISDRGIGVRFYPIQLKFRTYNWEEIDHVYLREYSPITEYGGWGMRYSFVGKGRALNVSGRVGIQLVFKDGRKLLIGTSQKEDVMQVLSVLGR